MRASEITEAIIAQGLRTNLGATPEATVGAQIYIRIVKDKSACPIEKVAKATFRWRGATKAAPNNVAASSRVQTIAVVDDDADEPASIITSFGMFWRRDHVRWSAKCRLEGKQRIESESVNFSEQLGVYLLYDGREVVYVGRSTDRPLGRRLFEHTSDRLGTRWDRFSWFGVRPVSEEGTLGQPPTQYDTGVLLPVLEAVLIEALEPRQNRKRGDDLGAVEYLQVMDEAIRRDHALQTVMSALKDA